LVELLGDDYLALSVFVAAETVQHNKGGPPLSVLEVGRGIDNAG
jgi:hypothetical protein